MDKLILEGGKKLGGTVLIGGSKNAALPIMAASLLTDEPCIFQGIPSLRDTQTMAKLLVSLGKRVVFEKNTVSISPQGPLKNIAHYDLVSTMRGSFCVLGPLLAKIGQAKVSLPGGCVIGVRPVDLHLKGLKRLNAKIEIENGYACAQAKRLKGSNIYLGGVFGSSVLATANVLMAATLAQGQTTIESAACEPEIEDLANCLIAMGAHIEGHGTPRITVQGVKKLKGVHYTIIPDRIEAGTFILLAAATQSEIILNNAYLSHLLALTDVLEEAGLTFDYGVNFIKVKASTKKLTPVSITTYPYPGFPTDLQAQYMTLMALTPGVSVIIDKVYPDRFIHIAELNRMGANIRREGMIGIVQGVKELVGAKIMASDLRASAALVIAGLAAKGKTEISRVYHLDRGYENLDQKLRAIGAKISRRKE